MKVLLDKFSQEVVVYGVEEALYVPFQQSSTPFQERISFKAE